MKKVIAAYVLILTDLNLTIALGCLSLFPVFLGWLLLFFGLSELSGEGEHFERLRPLALVMAAYKAAASLLLLSGLLEKTGLVAFLCGVVGFCMTFFVTLQLLLAFGEMKQYNGLHLSCAESFIYCVALLVATAAFCIVRSEPGLLRGCVAISATASVLFLNELLKVEREYAQLPAIY